MRYKVVATILCLIVFGLTQHNLPRVPAPWFDEGWVLSLARNWVVLGHYGHLLLGEPVPSTILNTGFPAVAPVALSFQIFDIGIWQGRWPGTLTLLGAFLLLYHLAQRLYGRKIAVWTAIVSLILPMHPSLHPIFMGRQALGEAPAMFYLLAGYALLFATWNKNTVFTFVAPLFFGLAVQTKPQLLPFWIASLLVPTFWLLWQRKWIETKYLSRAFILSLLFSFTISWGVRFLINPSAGDDVSSGDPYAVTRNIEALLTYVIVLDPAFRIRMVATMLGLTIGVPTIIGAIYIGLRQVGVILQSQAVDARSIWVLILWTFVFTWLCWFFLLSIGFVRHLFPAVLVGSIFTAKAFSEIVSGFNFIAVFKRLAKNLHERKLGLNSISLLTFTALFFFWSIMTITLSFKTLFSNPADAYSEVLTFLNNETPDTAIIEVYDSELFLFLERDYHYPPDSLQHALNRRYILGKVSVDYDPTPVGINYLVIGLTNEWWSLYDFLVAREDFELVHQNSGYSIYRNNTNLQDAK